MSEINEIILEKIKRYPPDVQKLILKALELSETSQPTAIADMLEGYMRDIVKDD